MDWTAVIQPLGRHNWRKMSLRQIAAVTWSVPVTDRCQVGTQGYALTTLVVITLTPSLNRACVVLLQLVLESPNFVFYEAGVFLTQLVPADQPGQTT